MRPTSKQYYIALHRFDFRTDCIDAFSRYDVQDCTYVAAEDLLEVWSVRFARPV